jgi:uncharacterized protein (TIGR02145 family)
MKKLIALLILLGLNNFCYSQIVTIGNQVWMTRNLDVDKFRNGDPIPEAKTQEEWEKAIQDERPAWCFFNNNPRSGYKYGKIYNWYAVQDSRGLAEEGWRIPNDEDWKTLSKTLSKNNQRRINFKKKHKVSERPKVTPLKIVCSNPPNLFCSSKNILFRRKSCYWWSISDNKYYAMKSMTYFKNGNIFRSDNKGFSGFAVRCIKD